VPVGGLIVNRVLPEDSGGHAFLEARKEQETRYLREIGATFGDLPTVCVPLLERDVVGEESLRQVVRCLGA